MNDNYFRLGKENENKMVSKDDDKEDGGEH